MPWSAVICCVWPFIITSITRTSGTQLFCTAGFLLTTCSPGVETRRVPRRGRSSASSAGHVHGKAEIWWLGEIMEILMGMCWGYPEISLDTFMGNCCMCPYDLAWVLLCEHFEGRVCLVRSGKYDLLKRTRTQHTARNSEDKLQEWTILLPTLGSTDDVSWVSMCPRCPSLLRPIQPVGPVFQIALSCQGQFFAAAAKCGVGRASMPRVKMPCS